jgi:FlaG/FlaF family flagellin (archaellin)
MRSERRLFRNKAQRSVIATWVVLALSVVAAALVAVFLRHPST